MVSLKVSPGRPEYWRDYIRRSVVVPSGPGDGRYHLPVGLAGQDVHLGSPDAAGRGRKDRAFGSDREVLSRRAVLLAGHHRTSPSDAHIRNSGPYRRRDRPAKGLHRRAAGGDGIRTQAWLRARREVELQQHRLPSAGHHHPQGIRRLLRRRSHSACLPTAGHDDGPGDQRGGHRAAPLGRLHDCGWGTEESIVGVAVLEHHGRRRAICR
jgi:hypothetical protein